MPSDHEGSIAWQHFATSSGSAIVPLHEPTFERQRQELDAARREGKPPNLHFVATFLAVCASGLASMPVEEASRSGSVSDVQALSSRWIGLAHRALLAGRFLETPTLEGVRAATLIALFHLNLSPEDGTAFALGLLGIAVQAAMSLGLHRTESMQREAHIESAVVHREGRRRVFYGLFCATVHAHSLFGVSWSAFESTRVQATFPLECSSELVRSGAVESPVAALICHCRIAVLANKITRLYNGTSTVSYSTIMEMNAELSEAEVAVPLAYKLREDASGNLLPLPPCPSSTALRAMSIQATIALQFLRIHRPWLPGAPLSNELAATLAESADRLRRRGRHSEIALKGSAVLDHVLRLHSTPDPSDLAPPPKHDEAPPTAADGEEGEDAGEGEEEKEEGEEEGEATGVHKGADGWQAVWSAEANAYYFWNQQKNLTTWENPLATPTASTSATPAQAGAAADGADPRTQVDYGGIDPELAYLDPNLARSSTTSSAAPSFQARFNSRTGRFQGDPTMNPDRISEYSRGERQQEVFYNTQAWQASLEGKGIKRAGEEAEGGKRKRVTAKDVERFKAKKLDKKKRSQGWLYEK
ncbi:hypothetical protein RQP46_003788 [Phenoliferia psychrophenolica]